MNARNGWEEGGRDGKGAKLVENKQVFVSNSPSNLMFELQSSLLEVRLWSSRHGQGGREGERRGGRDPSGVELRSFRCSSFGFPPQ